MSRLVMSLALAGALAACSKQDSTQPVKTAPAGSTTATATTPPSSTTAADDPARAKQLVATGAPVVDVRTAEEWSEGHLPTAKHIPVDEVEQRLADFEKLVGGDKSKPLVVYCASGNRSGKAKKKLEAAGFTNVVNGGGYDDLK